jgi:hypothetical protein
MQKDAYQTIKHPAEGLLNEKGSKRNITMPVITAMRGSWAPMV